MNKVELDSKKLKKLPKLKRLNLLDKPKPLNKPKLLLKHKLLLKLNKMEILVVILGMQMADGTVLTDNLLQKKKLLLQN
ncbi:hypothetical protein H0A38_07965 [Lactococcus lactis]|uniref:hypothetical protein n=1 Tax=Lactococcus lactis TaxID=1358 RepID=UPI001020E5DD|nr:hypothetical protein [Lactococcus lactis]QBC36748.1 hypothetical protein EQZ99_01450 [Lactococcus lactis]UCS89616.1 hypothetical protein H0A38_07965 [Lactococcus lactis]